MGCSFVIGITSWTNCVSLVLIQFQHFTHSAKLCVEFAEPSIFAICRCFIAFSSYAPIYSLLMSSHLVFSRPIFSNVGYCKVVNDQNWNLQERLDLWQQSILRKLPCLKSMIRRLWNGHIQCPGVLFWGIHHNHELIFVLLYVWSCGCCCRDKFWHSWVASITQFELEVIYSRWVMGCDHLFTLQLTCP